jgi:hypothetical protein
MLKKISLLINTLKYLKLSQCFFQVNHRLKSKQSIKKYKGKRLKVKDLVFNNRIEVARTYLNDNNFCFLNKVVNFKSDIDWNFIDFGKLWNYNLEYFDYLQQTDITVDEKRELINSFYSFSLKNKRYLEPYPVSLRTINLIKFSILNNIQEEDFLSYLYQELAYLHKNYELHILGNHLLENAFALCLGGAFFEKSKWHRKAIHMLKKELEEQILEDGAHFELSPMYHKIIFFRILELIDWYSKYDKKDKAFLSFCIKKASKMKAWLENIKFDNGDIPLFNDSAKFIAFPTKVLLSYSAQLNVSSADIPLSVSGYRSFRNENYEIKIDCAEIGSSYQPGHSHADALSFILYHCNNPLFVEQGTSTYNICARRDLERSTQAHNTVEYQNKNQSQVWGGFRVGERAKTTIIKDSEDFIEAVHNGYKKLGVLHIRSFKFEKCRVSIKDSLSQGNGVFYLHIHPQFTIQQFSNEFCILSNGVRIKFEGCQSITSEFYKYSDRYNEYEKAERLVVKFHKELLSTLIFPDSL